jgi:hypothetical protein
MGAPFFIFVVCLLVISVPVGGKFQSQDTSQDPEFGEFVQESSYVAETFGFPKMEG